MFLKEEERKQGEVSPSRESLRITKLSQAIREGCKITSESHVYFNGCGACTLGAAARATGYQGTSPSGAWEHLLCLFPMPYETMLSVSGRHYRGMNGAGPRITREQLADELESQGL